MENFEENLAGKEFEPKRVFVEMGTGNKPVVFQGERKFKEGDIYVGVEVDEEDLRSAKEFSPEGENINFIEASGDSLPFKNETVDELFFGNVFGYDAIPADRKNKFLAEAERVLKNGGRLIVNETESPATIYDLAKLLEGRRFIVEKFFNPKDNFEEWKKETQLYGFGSMNPVNYSQSGGPYLLYLKKTGI